jgi:hypothetical protein
LHQPLGCGDVDVAGTEQLVHRTDRLGPIGKGGDGHCAADAVDLRGLG